MLDNVGLRYPHRASGAKAPRTLRPLPLLRFAVSATGGAHLCSIQYYLRFWLGICRTSLAVSALRIMRYCPKRFGRIKTTGIKNNPCRAAATTDACHAIGHIVKACHQHTDNRGRRHFQNQAAHRCLCHIAHALFRRHSCCFHRCTFLPQHCYCTAAGQAMQRKSLLFTHKTGGFAAASGFMVFVYFCMMGMAKPPYSPFR